MKSLFDELIDRLAENPSLTRRGGPRQDIGILLFSERDSINALWKAADTSLRIPRDMPGLDDSLDESVGALRAAVEKLRPLFGER